MTDEIKVSVLCNTYNHELYIRDALEGFVSQQTDFKFEVLIHDDASTDKTADIIREYEAKYPDLIKPIYQTVNQYSQGVKVSPTYQFPRIQGKYVAVCEGDDYWTDCHKLQKQYDLMESHPEIDMCAHRARMIDGKTGEEHGFQGPGEEDALLTPQQVILGDGGFVSTASLFYRSDLIRELPKFRQVLGLDYTLQIHGSLRGGILYLGDVMNVYRVCTPGSWTDRIQFSYKNKRAMSAKIKKMLRRLNKDTHGKYRFTIAKMYMKMLYRDMCYIYLKIRGKNK